MRGNAGGECEAKIPGVIMTGREERGPLLVDVGPAPISRHPSVISYATRQCAGELV